jgi:transketolase
MSFAKWLKANEVLTVVKMLASLFRSFSGALCRHWTWLYLGGEMNLNSKDSWAINRDRIIVSGSLLSCACSIGGGWLLPKELPTLRKINSRLQGHPIARKLPGIENSSGPLGQGVSLAVGMAMAAKLDKKKYRVVCFMGDGEQNEGQVWEAYMSASKFELSNLTVVIDRNNIQIDGHTEDVMPIEPFGEKLKAFGFKVIEVDGHNIEEISGAMNMAKVTFEKPTAIVLHTIPGKNVDFMENEFSWHGKAPNVGESIQALMELRKLRTLDGRVLND